MTRSEILGKINFTAYGEAVGWKTHDGNEIPSWDNLAKATQDAWSEAAQASVRAYWKQMEGSSGS